MDINRADTLDYVRTVPQALSPMLVNNVRTGPDLNRPTDLCDGMPSMKMN